MKKDFVMKKHANFAALVLLATTLGAFAGTAQAAGKKPVTEDGALAANASATSRPDCVDDRCVGDTAYVSHRDYYVKLVRIDSITADRRFLVKWADGSIGPQGGFAAGELVIAAGNSMGVRCKGQYCLGDTAIVNDRAYNVKMVKIVGLQGGFSPSYLVQWSDGSIGPSSGDTFSPSSLARIGQDYDYACSGGICVGDTARVNHRDYNVKTVTIAAVTSSGNFIVKWGDGSLGPQGGFAAGDLAMVSRRERTQEELDRDEVEKLSKEPGFDHSIYQAARAKGMNHRDAVEAAKGPYWVTAADTERFLGKLANHVYQFDANYLIGVQKLLPKDAQREKAAFFISAALLPYLRNFGYPGLRDKYVLPSVKNIEAQLQGQGLTAVSETESSISSRKYALQMLGVSLQTAMVQMDLSQKERAAEALRVIAASLATPMRVRDLGAFLNHAPELEKLLLELSLNPYLQGRVATDMGLLAHVRNS